MMIATLLSLLAAVAAQPSFEPATCPASLQIPKAKCGTVRVPENRRIANGREIALNLILLPAANAPPRLPPLFDIDGGPGLNSTKNAEFYASNAVSKDRDVVLLDQRGTGRSNPLECPELAAVKPTEPMLPPAAVQRCRDLLAAKVDLRSYGTSEAVADLETVRQALGYRKIDLFGLSYGTTVALRYMHRYPGNVRAAVLMGVAPPDAMPPRHHATAAAEALGLLIEDCKRDTVCNRRFPALADTLGRTHSAIAKKDGALAAELFLERLRTRLYAPASRAGLPLAIERAASGDLTGFYGSAGAAGPPVADGMFLAVTCSESFALMPFDAATAAAKATSFGDYRLRRQREACREWPTAKTDEDHLSLPVDSSASVLVISGAMDPVTPPSWGEAVSRSLRNTRHIVIPGGGHIPDGLSGLETCLDPLMIAFLDHGDPKRLDASCIAEMKAPAYAVQ
jgi:pimeloyl-ACP methyl ester carboxylesterase